jgi:thioredoxin reductase
MERARPLANDGAEELARSFAHDKNIHLIREHARLEGRDGSFLIRAGAALVRAERVVPDTGNRTAGPSIPDLADIPLITAENWIVLRELPAQLILLGGSYIALEMAQSLQRLGSQVTVEQKANRLAEREDPDVGEMLRRILEKDGCRVYLNADVQRVEAVGTRIRLQLPTEILEGTHLFLAVGQQPNTDDLGLDSVGVETDDQGYVMVDDRLRVQSKESGQPATSVAALRSPMPPTTTTGCGNRSCSATARKCVVALCLMRCSQPPNSAGFGRIWLRPSRSRRASHTTAASSSRRRVSSSRAAWGPRRCPPCRIRLGSPRPAMGTVAQCRRRVQLSPADGRGRWLAHP